MSIFIESGYGHTDLSQLNRCRIFHRVFFISDIATADGKCIDTKYRMNQPNMDRTSQWTWPQQGLPDRQAWKLWDNALTYLEQQGKLRVSLGAWLIPSHQTWAWKSHLQTQLVVHTTEEQTHYYRPMITGNTRQTTQLYSLDHRGPPPEALHLTDGWANATPIFFCRGTNFLY
jgi:hypothetical protein